MREAALSQCSELQNIRSSKYSAVRLRYRTVAAPNTQWGMLFALACARS